jgi:Arc/MetJ-type ribon-helix-helix transcriptional regulator
MARIGVRKGNIRKISVSISEDSADWLETQVESENYRSVSHAVDSVIRDAMKAKTKATL